MSLKNTYILGIESSCDDTAAAILRNGAILSNVVANQSIHESYEKLVPIQGPFCKMVNKNGFGHLEIISF